MNEDNMSLEITEEEAIRELLEMARREETYLIPLQGERKLPVVLKALSDKEITAIREKCTRREKTSKGLKDVFDNDEFNASLIVAATVSPDWGNQNILREYNLSGPQEVVKRFAGGYLAALGERVLEVSGYGVDMEQIKN